MARFKTNSNMSRSKAFIISRSELEGRLEAEYYKPDILLLENKIRNKTSKRLKDFIIKLASGGTPPVTEEDKYYGGKEDGVPFLRVQNLNVNGKLLLDDVKYINRETHETLLKRSQVEEHDLLVKITGVGRMAIASVAPDGFTGNTNQHMVVIKTGRKEISDYLANYLNLDLTERLATRRSTGATRPALDYSALKSIPIVENIDFSLLYKAERLKEKKELEINNLLGSIDTHLLNALGIRFQQHDNSLAKRMFVTHFSDLCANRFDSQYNNLCYKHYYEALTKGKFNVNTIRSISLQLTNGKEFREYSKSGFRYLRVSDLAEHGIVDRNIRFINIPEIPKSVRLTYDDFLISRSGSLGLVSAVTDQLIDVVLSSHIFKLRLNRALVDPLYLEVYLRSPLGQFQFFQKNNGGVIPEINQTALRSIKIITPPLAVQNEISKAAMEIRAQAIKLQHEADEVVEEAKRKIENQILDS